MATQDANGTATVEQKVDVFEDDDEFEEFETEEWDDRAEDTEVS